MARFAWWYGMFHYIRSVRVEYVLRIPSVTTLYVDHRNVFKNIDHADRQTDGQTDTFAITETDTWYSAN